MISLGTLFLILALLLVIVLWQDGLRVKTLAVEAAKRVCEQQHYQLLDETVALKKMSLLHFMRHKTIQRLYVFDYVNAMGQRQSSTIEMHGKIVAVLSLKPQSNVITFPLERRRPAGNDKKS